MLCFPLSKVLHITNLINYIVIHKEEHGCFIHLILQKGKKMVINLSSAMQIRIEDCF